MSLAVSIILVSISIFLLFISLLIFIFNILPKQYIELALGDEKRIKGTRRALFFGTICLTILISFLIILAIPYLFPPVAIRVPFFLYAYIACGIASCINAILWYFIYNIDIKRPYQFDKTKR